MLIKAGVLIMTKIGKEFLMKGLSLVTKRVVLVIQKWDLVNCNCLLMKGLSLAMKR